MKKKIIVLSSLFYLLVSTATPAFAVTKPSFPACANPQGTTKVSYADGTHGIVGSTATYTGKDAVYTLSDDTVTQCFCSADGVGIQTNWWKASSLTEEEINILKSEGWFYIPAGNLWGLDQAPYVAQNISYSCLPGSSSSSSSSSNNSSSQDNGTGGGDPEGSVLGLAATGNIATVYAAFILATTFLFLGLRKSK